MADRTTLDAAFGVVAQLLAARCPPTATNDNTLDALDAVQLNAQWAHAAELAGRERAAKARNDLSRWHLGEAMAAEAEAERTGSPGRRIRLLNAAQMHRQCAELALQEA